MNLRTFKVAALTLFAALIATNVSAQSVKYPKMHFGIRVGGTIHSASGIDSEVKDIFKEHSYELKGHNFVTGGLALDFRIASIPLYLETGAYFTDRSVTLKYIDEKIEGISDYDSYDNNDNEYYTVQVPLLLSYHHYIGDKTAIQPFIGGYADLGGAEMGAGVRLGVGINYGRLYANIGYDIEMLTRTYEEYFFYYRDAEYKAPGLFATIGFNFGGSR